MIIIVWRVIERSTLCAEPSCQSVGCCVILTDACVEEVIIELPHSVFSRLAWCICFQLVSQVLQPVDIGDRLVNVPVIMEVVSWSSEHERHLCHVMKDDIST
jgi:hypothetical protein